MQLPINLQAILNQHTIESERIEFKKNWNPIAIFHTLCAFANDFHNFGGGYLIIGVEEKNGRPILPPVGLDFDEVDNMQKELLFLGNKIHPTYTPIAHPYKMDGKYILAIWAPGGFERPYKAPRSLIKGDKDFRYYIRKNSSTVQANHSEEKELMELSGRIPFDDRINYEATLDDLEFTLIYDFLKKIKSGLRAEADKIPFAKLCRQMNIVRGPDEALRPLNAGLLFFNQNPQKFFPQTQIDIVELPEGLAGDVLRERIFTGPIDKAVKDALSYLKNQIVEEVIIKHPDRAEAERFFNVPYIALEESIVNAIYHRDYQIREPIEVRILPDEITVASHPGPDRSISLEALKDGKFISRRYRNRRIGDFLKELELTEGRGTGVPKIVMAMESNSSPLPVFESNEDRSYFVVRLPLHPKAIQKRAESRQSHDRVTTESIQNTLIETLRKGPLSKNDLAKSLGQKIVTSRLDKAIRALLDSQLIERTIPEKPNSRLQQYILKESSAPKTTESRQSHDRVTTESIQNTLIETLRKGPLSKNDLAKSLGQKTVTSRLDKAIRALLDSQLIERTIPEKPNSRLQQYILKESSAPKTTESRQSHDRVTTESIQNTLIETLRKGPLSKNDLAKSLGQKAVTSRLDRAIRALLDNQIIARTIPEKPNSRLQQYMLTKKGKIILNKK